MVCVHVFPCMCPKPFGPVRPTPTPHRIPDIPVGRNYSTLGMFTNPLLAYGGQMIGTSWGNRTRALVGACVRMCACVWGGGDAGESICTTQHEQEVTCLIACGKEVCMTQGQAGRAVWDVRSCATTHELDGRLG